MPSLSDMVYSAIKVCSSCTITLAGNCRSFGTPWRNSSAVPPSLWVDRWWIPTWAGCVPLVTGAPAEVLKLMAEQKPHLVLLDLVLPGSDGIQLTNDIRRTADSRWSSCRCTART